MEPWIGKGVGDGTPTPRGGALGTMVKGGTQGQPSDRGLTGGATKPHDARAGRADPRGLRGDDLPDRHECVDTQAEIGVTAVRPGWTAWEMMGRASKGATNTAASGRSPDQRVPEAEVRRKRCRTD